MVLINEGKIYIKIIYWGMYASGKTTILDTLFKITQKEKKDIVPVGNLTKIGRTSGSTLYFDRGLFQSKKQEKVFYTIYAVAGQRSFSSLRKRVFEGTDGIIFVADSQVDLLDENIQYLKELKDLAKGKLIRNIPLVVMLNKQDLNDVIHKSNFESVLNHEKLWFNSGSNLSHWNPEVFETCALYEKKQNIYEAFQECSRRTVLYHLFGDGEAPSGNYQIDFPIQEK
ncbi:MAG: hypothetical protein GF317_22605 [Candidatus Lokiarchaeota archaeon]|nr:hypothetical protein [Candidatus Lokiarchaeota archaeon]MBD3202253.1 hypothetical protein [Candidatus Lokiarchaeota archaeon]